MKNLKCPECGSVRTQEADGYNQLFCFDCGNRFTAVAAAYPSGAGAAPDGDGWEASKKKVDGMLAAQSVPLHMMSGAECLLRGIELLESKPTEAIRYLRVAAEEGIGLAQYRLGEAYEKGKGVELNTGLAVHWYEQSASRGVESAKAVLRERYPEQSKIKDIDEVSRISGNSRIPELYKRCLPNIFELRCTSRGGQLSLGTGFLVEEDLIVTNSHVVTYETSKNNFKLHTLIEANQDASISAKSYGLTCLYHNSDWDIALLEINGKPPRFEQKKLRLADSCKINVGEEVITVGNAKGFSLSLAHGRISRRSEKLPDSSYDEVLQLNMDINGGNSGGPLINMTGEVIGMTTFSPCMRIKEQIFAMTKQGLVIAEGTGHSVSYGGIAFAVTSNTIKKAINNFRRRK